jgi:hypothetical protein
VPGPGSPQCDQAVVLVCLAGFTRLGHLLRVSVDGFECCRCGCDGRAPLVRGAGGPSWLLAVSAGAAFLPEAVGQDVEAEDDAGAGAVILNDADGASSSADGIPLTRARPEARPDRRAANLLGSTYQEGRSGVRQTVARHHYP